MQKSLDEGLSAATALQTAQTNRITGTANLITKMTQKRLAAEAQAKLDKVA